MTNLLFKKYLGNRHIMENAKMNDMKNNSLIKVFYKSY